MDTPFGPPQVLGVGVTRKFMKVGPPEPCRAPKAGAATLASVALQGVDTKHTPRGPYSATRLSENLLEAPPPIGSAQRAPFQRAPVEKRNSSKILVKF